MKRCVLFPLLLAGCAEFPDLEGTVSPESENAPFMDFLTPDELNALNQGAAPVAEDPLAGRLAALRARAAQIRGTVITPEERETLTNPPG
ncbi:MAG: hypothetical protein AAF576_07905 [Pseudomonadota bacterium]